MQRRTSWQVTLHVWHALFFRDLTGRMTTDRMAAVWLFLEPALHVMVMIGIRKLIGANRVVPGVDFVSWLLMGIMAFFLFRDTLTRSMNGIASSTALFAYRQVLPVDTVLVRGALEGILRTVTLLTLSGAVAFYGLELKPHDPLGALAIWSYLWILGLGCALVCSVLITIVPETGKFIPILLMPMYVLSGAMIPPHILPYSLREYLLYNPVLHGVEAFRLCIFPNYHTITGIDVMYLQQWAICSLLLGLMLQVRYQSRLKAQ